MAIVITSSNSLFTPPTRTRQDSLVLCVSAVWTQLATRQDSFVLSRPSFQFATLQSHICWGLLKTWKLETGSRRDKTHQNCLVLSAVVFTPPTRTRQDSLVLSVSAVWTGYKAAHSSEIEFATKTIYLRVTASQQLLRFDSYPKPSIEQATPASTLSKW